MKLLIIFQARNTVIRRLAIKRLNVCVICRNELIYCIDRFCQRFSSTRLKNRLTKMYFNCGYAKTIRHKKLTDKRMRWGGAYIKIIYGRRGDDFH